MADLLFDAADAETPTEEVIYRPDGGVARPIRAYVVREQPEAYGRARAAVTTVQVLNHATDGITAAELNKGSDTIDVAERYGGTKKNRGVHRIIEQNGAYLLLEVR